MCFYKKYKSIRRKLRKQEWFYRFSLFIRKVELFLPYHFSFHYIKHILKIKVTKILRDATGATAFKYATGETQDNEKVFIKICVRKIHKNINLDLVKKFSSVAKYKDKNINNILYIKQGVLLNFIVSSYVEDFIRLEDLEIKKITRKNKKLIFDELAKMVIDLAKAKIVHNDIHDENIILAMDKNNKDTFYLALTDFSLAKEYNDPIDWKKGFLKNDYDDIIEILKQIDKNYDTEYKVKERIDSILSSDENECI